MSDTTTVSIVKTINNIIDTKINLTKPKTTSSIVLYKAGSTLTPTYLGQLSF